MLGRAKREKTFHPLRFHLDIFVCCLSWICKYSIRFQDIKLKLLCETLKNEKWKILARYPDKLRQYRQWNPQCDDWHWMNFQMQVALEKSNDWYKKVPMMKQSNSFRISGFFNRVKWWKEGLVNWNSTWQSWCSKA